MLTVVISGGSGLVGRHLSQHLEARGYRVLHLSRTRKAGMEKTVFLWDWERGYIEQGALEAADVLIHLAGAGIFDERWTDARKALIEQSRVASGDFLLQKLKEIGKRPRVFVSASATGYYGAVTSEHVFVETDRAADDFLGRTTQHWEAMAERFQQSGIRTVMLRTGVVLAPEAALVTVLGKLARWGLAAPLGTGAQYLPWIHIDDLCAMYVKAIEDQRLTGAYNAVAPQAVNLRAFTKTLAAVMKRVAWLPAVPAFLLRMVLGERAIVVTKGSRVSSKKIELSGYEFRHPELREALQQLIGKPF